MNELIKIWRLNFQEEQDKRIKMTVRYNRLIDEIRRLAATAEDDRHDDVFEALFEVIESNKNVEI